ncbi:MAG: hypothetical protein HYR73_07070 [Candidatus Eisenbacteria bacterium]|nr:hypothetical protein [Candidatus Eisenbacteria bacterium]
MARPKSGSGAGPATVLRWTAWALGILSLASAFAPISRELARSLSWVLCLYAILEAGIAIGRGRRGAWIAYAAVAIVLNPFVPFHFPLEAWRLLYAATGVWLIADHLREMR